MTTERTRDYPESTGTEAAPRVDMADMTPGDMVDRVPDSDAGTAAVGTSAGHRSWDEAGPSYRQEWERRHGASGRRWEDVEPGYRYGHEMAGDPRYHGREWADAESDLRSGYSDWSRRQNYRSEEGAWDRIKDDVREAWERLRRR